MLVSCLWEGMAMAMIPCINATLIPAPCPLKQNHGISQDQATPFGGQLALLSL
jgi:hypothetical protein